MATEDARYRQSTQFRLWSFAPSHLSSMRLECNSLARKAVTAHLQSTDPPVDPLPDFLTPSEEAALLKHFTNELFRLADFCKLPTDIRSTAAIFLRRFYVTNSVMTYPPTELLKTCLFFGCKAEGFYMRLSDFASKIPKTTGEGVLAPEYILCQGIRFAFDVHHPFRGLEGAIMELRRLGEFEKSRIDRAHGRARDILKFSPIVTDAYFHYTPSQIMLAALMIADEGLVERLVRQAFAVRVEAAKEKVLGVLTSCRDMLKTEPPENKEKMESDEAQAAMKPLIKKLRKCRDPDRVDLVALQKAKKEAVEQKAKKPKPKTDDGAVFGGPLDDRDAKRRKTVGKEDDPFGPALI